MKLAGFVFVCLFAVSTYAQQPTVNVSFDKPSAAQNDEVSVRMALTKAGKPSMLPKEAKDVKAWYQVCGTSDLKASPSKSTEVFCGSDNPILFKGDVDTPEFSKAGEPYTFKQAFKIPENASQQRLWAIVFLSFTTSKDSSRLYGWHSLTRHCKTSSTTNKATGKVDCRFYTAAAWAIEKAATSVGAGTPVSPKP